MSFSTLPSKYLNSGGERTVVARDARTHGTVAIGRGSSGGSHQDADRRWQLESGESGDRSTTTSLLAEMIMHACEGLVSRSAPSTRASRDTLAEEARGAHSSMHSRARTLEHIGARIDALAAVDDRRDLGQLGDDVEHVFVRVLPVGPLVHARLRGGAARRQGGEE